MILYWNIERKGRGGEELMMDNVYTPPLRGEKIKKEFIDCILSDSELEPVYAFNHAYTPLSAVCCNCLECIDETLRSSLGE